MEVINTSGRRKTAVARLYMKPGKGSVTINKKDANDYFTTSVLQYKINQPFMLTETAGQYDVQVNVDGGGITGQAEAIRLGLSRALKGYDPTLEQALRDAGYLSRDSRKVERKKYGQRGARRRFQFSKR